MARTTTKTLALLALALLGSCEALGSSVLQKPERFPLKPEERAASAGPEPSPEAAKVIADLYLRKGLKDYDSARIQWGTDVRLATWDEYDRERALETKRAAYREVAGWEFYANVNAKNGFGAYSGWQAWRFRFRLDRLAAAEQVSAAPLR